MYIGSRKCFCEKNFGNFCYVINIWVVLLKGNFYLVVDFKNNYKCKIDIYFFFLIIKMVFFVIVGYFF